MLTQLSEIEEPSITAVIKIISLVTKWKIRWTANECDS